jgi:hypothetical protein
MTIDLIRTCERAIDEKWDKPEVLRLLMFGLLEHIEGMERRASERVSVLAGRITKTCVEHGCQEIPECQHEARKADVAEEQAGQ